jgi:SAM-dependent methyltransferase
MRATEAEKRPPAGISEAERLDVPALFARLRDELRHAPGLDVADELDRGLVRQRLRSIAEATWPVTSDRPLEHRRGPVGALRLAVKKVLRKLMRWYVEPVAASQRAFNGIALKLVDELFEEIDLLYARLARAETELGAARERERLLAEVDERLTRVERRPASGAAAVPPTVASQPGQTALPDYFAFESRMRGTTHDVRARQEAYVEDFRGCATVLDLGCGRGELLSLLREAGIDARGVDADADMVAYARGEGLDVVHADVFAYLDDVADASLEGIFAGQVVEHLPPPALVRLLELARAKLGNGGVLVLETINPLSPLALRNYFADLTHAQPLVPGTLELLARQAGFRDVETRFLNAPGDEERLRRVDLPDTPEFDRARAALAANVTRVNELLFAPLDYAIVARA